MSTSVSDAAPLAADEQPSCKERSIWRDVPIEEWRDWHWQMRNRITSA